MRNLLTALLAAALLAATVTLAGCGAEESGRITVPPASTEAAGEGTGLEVYFFQAGKADAILLTTANSTVLIDCGVKGFGKTILSYLEEKGIDHIDYLIVTHFDQDHVGGAAKVINNIPVYNVLQSNFPKDSTEYEKYVKALNNAGIEAVTVSETLAFTLDGVTFTVDPPHATSYQSDESNNSSLVVSVTHGDVSLLFTGDAQTERLEELLEGGIGTCDFVKIPHHGGEEPLLEELLKAARPDYAVIICSDDEPEADSTLALLEEYGVTTYLTRQGAVLLRSDGTDLTVSYLE